MNAQASEKVLNRKLAMLGVDDRVRATLRPVARTLDVFLDGIVERFYGHMRTFPEGRRIFTDPAMVESLKARQMAHWKRLFECRLDADYMAHALRIGRAHYDRGVAPYLYIAGYNFFQCELMGAVSDQFRGDRRLTDMLTSITRVVSLDMDLAISVYTREIWNRREETVEI